MKHLPAIGSSISRGFRGGRGQEKRVASITVNGDVVEIPEGTSIATLLETLRLQPRFVAVERNEQLVPRKLHAEELLQPGDRLEIVTLVGGG